MVTTVKPRPPHVAFAMSGRRHRSPLAATSVSFRPPRSVSSSVRGALVALCCLVLVLFLALSVSAAAEDSAGNNDGDGSCLGFRDSCADLTSFCFSLSAARTLLAREDGNEEADLGGSRDWGPSSRPLGFPLSDGSMVTCSSVDTMITRARDRLVPEGDGGVKYNVASCQAPLVPDNWMRASAGVPLELDGMVAAVEPSVVHSSLSMNVAISPPVLDWGSSNLYAASTATLTVVNLNNDSTLRLYEPFSTGPQFYVYGYEDLELQPGDNASLTFVFLPKLLGFSSAHLVLQTNFGGFIIQAKGLAVGSPYQILPLTGIDVVIGDCLERNLSIYNPYGDTLYVEEVAVWMSSLPSTGQSSHIVCQLGHSDGALELSSLNNNWYTARNAESGKSVIYIRPSEQWEVLPSKSNSVVELKLQPLSEGKVFGAISLKLRNSTAIIVDTFVIPIELEVHKRTYYDSSGLVAVTFERTSSCAASGSIFSLYLQNDAPKLLRIVGVTENNRNGPMIFQIKYLDGLILFPDTVTHIALVSHTSFPDPDDISFNSCNIVVETNSTLCSSIIIPCEDLVHASLSYISNVVVAESDGLFTGPLYEEISANANTRTLGSMLQVEGLHSVKSAIMKAGKVDDIILRQWISHGTSDGISVLMDHELTFPVVQIGSQFSKWITVHNPSMEHAAMQLVMNSEEVIDQCKTVNDACERAFSSRSPEIDSTKTRFGFSLSEDAITETLVGPLETALLGPIVFRPSNRCMWSSMALIRNNLSGVEILPLEAHGGWQSIALLEGSEPAWKLEFNLDYVQNTSTMNKSDAPSPLCSQQLSKEINVKNSGDLPLQVTKVKISGADCAVDGFTVDNCKGFSLAPDESIRMLISFQADFSSAMVQRDLELAMTTGIFIIPMTANIPVCMLNQCRKSYIRSTHWKLLVLFFGAVTLLVLIFVRYVPHSLTVESHDHYIKIDDGKSTIFEENRKSTVSKTVKPSFLQHSNKKPRSIKEHRRTEEARTEKYSATVLDSSKRADDKNNHGEQVNTISTVSVSPANPVEDKVSREAPQTSDNLTLRISREKGKRRRRKVGGAGLATKFEVSSSHSGNSTPSSPLSPSSTPKQGWSSSGVPSELKHENKLESKFDVEATATSTGTNSGKKSWSQTAKEQPRPSSATPGNTLPSDTVLTTAWRSPLLTISSPPIAPHARAPGSNLTKDKVSKRDGGTPPKKEFTYDIWGHDFSGHLLGKAKEAAPYNMFDASEGGSCSFFATEPQALMMKPSSLPPVSRSRGSPPSDVSSAYGIK